jgi:hypothetical protein
MSRTIGGNGGHPQNLQSTLAGWDRHEPGRDLRAMHVPDLFCAKNTQRRTPRLMGLPYSKLLLANEMVPHQLDLSKARPGRPGSFYAAHQDESCKRV